MKPKIYTCSLLLTILLLSGFSFVRGGELRNRESGAHTLSLGYSPVLWGWWYQNWKPVPPLKFSLRYTYDIPMRSRFVNFYAIGEVSYIGALHKGVVTTAPEPGEYKEVAFKQKWNSVILSAGIGIKLHLVRFLDFAVFYTGGYRYTKLKADMMDFAQVEHDFSGCVGARFIGKIKKVNVFAGYSFAHLAPAKFVREKDHYVDVGIGYTF